VKSAIVFYSNLFDTWLTILSRIVMSGHLWVADV
jgi:hypothetical protein